MVKQSKQTPLAADHVSISRSYICTLKLWFCLEFLAQIRLFKYKQEKAIRSMLCCFHKLTLRNGITIWINTQISAGKITDSFDASVSDYERGPIPLKHFYFFHTNCYVVQSWAEHNVRAQMYEMELHSAPLTCILGYRFTPPLYTHILMYITKANRYNFLLHKERSIFMSAVGQFIKMAQVVKNVKKLKLTHFLLTDISHNWANFWRESGDFFHGQQRCRLYWLMFSVLVQFEMFI